MTGMNDALKVVLGILAGVVLALVLLAGFVGTMMGGMGRMMSGGMRVEA